MCIAVHVQIAVLHLLSWVELHWVFNVTINDISVTYVTAHICAGGLKKKLDLRSGSQRHRHFVGFFNSPVLAPPRDHPFYTVILTHRPIKSPFTIKLGIRRTHSRLNPPRPSWGFAFVKRREIISVLMVLQRVMQIQSRRTYDKSAL